MVGASISTTVTDLPASRVRVVAQVAPEEVARTIDQAARQLGLNMRIPGFRKGKAPPPLIVQRVGRSAVVDRAVQDGLKRWYGAALDDAGIAPVGQPELDVGDPPADGQPMTFSIEIGVRPVATLGRYKGLEVGRREPEIDEQVVDAELQALRQRLAQAKAVQRPARNGDLVLIDFDGLIGDEPFDGGRGRDQMVELGSGMLVAGFETQLEGATAGEERVVTIDFPNVDSPQDHRAEEVAGDRASFIVDVKQVLAKELPELDDALARETAGCDTLEQLRADVAARLRADDERRVAAEFREAVLDAAAAEASVELPAALVAARAGELWEHRLRLLGEEGITKEVHLQIAGATEEELRAQLEPEAEQQLRREAVLAAVAVAEGIEVTEQELRAARRDSAERSTSQRRPGTLREELAGRRASDLLATQAVAITVERAQEQGAPDG
jgi:trigger factor